MPGPSRPLLRGAVRRAASAVAASAGFAPASLSKEQARALPSSKGGVEPRQLQVSRADIKTYFTVVGGTHLLYSAESWVRIRLTLEDAGPVAVGDAAQLDPVLSGRGVLLDTDQPQEYTLGKGMRIYIAAENAANRVKVVVDPIPWLEQIDLDLQRVGAVIAQVGSQIVSAIAGAIAGMRSAAPEAVPSTSQGTPITEIPCPPADRSSLPRLTPLPRGMKIPGPLPGRRR